MRNTLILFFSLITSLSFSQNKLAIEKIIQRENLSNSTVSITIKTTDGKNILGYNNKQSLTPASVLKLVTTASALEILGNNYRYETQLIYDDSKNELIIKGFGDPTLGSKYFTNNANFLNTWLTQINRNIAKDKPLNIVIDDSYFGYSGVSRKWIFEDLGNYYAAGSYGISIFDNTYQLSLNSMDIKSCPKIISIKPYININFDNQLLLNKSGRDNAFINGLPFSNNRKLIGNIPSNRTNFIIKGDIPDPGMLLGFILKDNLKKNGYTINNLNTTRHLYQSEFCMQKNTSLTPVNKIFYKNISPTITDIIKVVNVYSNNNYAEHLVRSIGRNQNQNIYFDPLEEGLSSIKTFWSNKFDSQSLFMYDGSGLSPSNKISTDMLTDILLYMYNDSKYSVAFKNSLPIAGQNGTVKNLFKGSYLDGKLYIKSGSLNNVQSFAGYYINNDKKYVFAIIVNNFDSPHKEIIKAIENILLEYLK